MTGQIRNTMICILLFCNISLLLPELAAQQQIHFRTPQEAVRYYEDLVGNLTRQVRSMQDENAMAVSSLRDLQTRIREMEADQKALRLELQNLRRQISADAESRRTQFNALADKIIKNTPGRNQTPPAAPSRKKEQSAASEEEQEFFEHTVEAGTTLSALARAYKVSVKDIEKANKIRKGRIYTGQKLLIPVSKKK